MTMLTINPGKFLILTLSAFMLTGCNNEMSYNYLMQHPQVLRHEVTDCQSAEAKTQREISQCEIVMYAAANFNALVDEQQSDPEKFGQRIMDAEVAYIKLKADVTLAQESVATLKAKNASGKDLQTAQAALDKAQKDMKSKKEELKTLLAVMGINTPE